MLCPKLGGIQQVFCDYDLALRLQNIHTLNIVHPFAKIKKELRKNKANLKYLFNVNQYDPVAVLQLKHKIKNYAPDVIIVHGNRAATLARKATKKSKIPIIAVCHNKKIKRLIGVNALFIILEALRKNALELGQPPKTSYYIPNMIQLEKNAKFTPRKFHKTVVIGTLGRLVEEKALDVLLDALAILKSQNIPFKVLIPGTGKLEVELRIQTQNLGLEKEVEFIGWISNKKSFSNNPPKQ